MKTIIKISVLLSLLFFIYQCDFLEAFTVKTPEQVLEEYKHKEKDARFSGLWRSAEKKYDRLYYYSSKGYRQPIAINTSKMSDLSLAYMYNFSVNTEKKEICLPQVNMSVWFWHTDKKNKIIYFRMLRGSIKQSDSTYEVYYKFGKNNNELTLYDETKDPETSLIKLTQKELDSIYQVGVKKGYIGCK